MHSKTGNIVLTVAILGIVVLLWVAYFYFTLSPLAARTDAQTQPTLIQKGEGLSEIATQLEHDGYIRSASAFKLYAILSGSAHQLKPGMYNVSSSSSTSEIVRLLVHGPSKEIQVLITEGERLVEIDSKLAKFGIIRPGDLIHFDLDSMRDTYPFLLGARSLEGYLFPDTYRFFSGSTPKQAVIPFLENFADKIGPLIADEGRVDYDNIPIIRRGIYSINKIATIASLLEKEVPGSDDRRMVADIIYRRLKIGMALQVDATVEYAKSHGDEFDTYKNPGLPPTPIASPSLDAITAALNPKSNQFVYYLSDTKTDHTIFAKTFEEHKVNKAKYLK